MLNRLLNQEQSGKTSKGGSAFQKIGKGEAGAAPVGERRGRILKLRAIVNNADGARLWSSSFPRDALHVNIQIYVHIISERSA